MKMVFKICPSIISIKRDFAKSLLALSCFSAMPIYAQSESSEKILSDYHFNLGIGYNQYQESIMQLNGPEVVVGLSWLQKSSLHLKGEYITGVQSYKSDITGTLRGIPNHELRLIAFYQLGTNNSLLKNYQIGLATHFIKNDLRGQTSTNARGYERISEQLWLPIRWQSFFHISNLKSDLIIGNEIGILVLGRQISRLSQVSSNYSDTINTQRSGQYFEFRLARSKNIPHWESYIRLTNVNQSNNVTNKSGQLVYEPSNIRIQMGLTWIL